MRRRVTAEFSSFASRPATSELPSATFCEQNSAGRVARRSADHREEDVYSRSAFETSWSLIASYKQIEARETPKCAACGIWRRWNSTWMLDIDAESAPRPPPILAAGAARSARKGDWRAGDAAMAERWGVK